VTGTDRKPSPAEVELARAIRDWRARKVLRLLGTVVWQGDLDESRRSRA
jgi:hypothetical protein